MDVLQPKLRPFAGRSGPPPVLQCRQTTPISPDHTKTAGSGTRIDAENRHDKRVRSRPDGSSFERRDDTRFGYPCLPDCGIGGSLDLRDTGSRYREEGSPPLTVLRRLALVSALTAMLALAGSAHAAAVTVTVTVTGSGHVTSNVGSIDCNAVSGSCSAQVNAGTSVTFTAQPSPGIGGPAASFTGWGGTAGCTGSLLTCTVVVNTSGTVTAAFSAVQAELNVSMLGRGTGSVTSAPSGIDCGTTCTATFTDPTKVTLTAAPGTDSKMGAWGGVCQDQPATGPCVVTVTGGVVNASVDFDPAKSSLVVLVTGTGSGRVTSGDSTIDCGSTCSASYADGTSVTLSPKPAPGSKLSHWSGPCASSSTGNTCVVVVKNGPVTVSAVFDLKTSGESDGADTQVDAELISIKQLRSASHQRIVRVELGVDETVSADLQMARGDQTIASRHIATLREGDQFIKLPIAKKPAGGSATLTIVLHDHAGNELTIQRTVRLAKP